MMSNQAIYRFSRPIGGLRLARFISRNHPKILMYHRISEEGGAGKIGVDTFNKQLEVIKRNFHPMTMNELYEAYLKNKVPKNAVVVTFDDGYSDFSEYAFPSLKRHGVPATLFVTVGFVNNDLWLWPDEIRYAIAHSKIGNYIQEGIPEPLDIAGAPGKCWHAIADFCMTIDNSRKNELISNLYEDLEVERPKNAPPGYEPITWDDLRSMNCEGLEIGCHSYSHPILTKVSDDELEKELCESKHIILRETGVDPVSFCYPNGQTFDFDSRVKRALDAAGYNYAVAAFSGVKPLNNRWEINRYPISGSNEFFEKTLYGMTYISNLISI